MLERGLRAPRITVMGVSNGGSGIRRQMNGTELHHMQKVWSCPLIYLQDMQSCRDHFFWEHLYMRVHEIFHQFSDLCNLQLHPEPRIHIHFDEFLASLQALVWSWLALSRPSLCASMQPCRVPWHRSGSKLPCKPVFSKTFWELE